MENDKTSVILLAEQDEKEEMRYVNELCKMPFEILTVEQTKDLIQFATRMLPQEYPYKSIYNHNMSVYNITNEYLLKCIKENPCVLMDNISDAQRLVFLYHIAKRFGMRTMEDLLNLWLKQMLIQRYNIKAEEDDINAVCNALINSCDFDTKTPLGDKLDNLLKCVDLKLRTDISDAYLLAKNTIHMTLPFFLMPIDSIIVKIRSGVIPKEMVEHLEILTGRQIVVIELALKYNIFHFKTDELLDNRFLIKRFYDLFVDKSGKITADSQLIYSLFCAMKKTNRLESAISFLTKQADFYSFDELIAKCMQISQYCCYKNVELIFEIGMKLPYELCDTEYIESLLDLCLINKIAPDLIKEFHQNFYGKLKQYKKNELQELKLFLINTISHDKINILTEFIDKQQKVNPRSTMIEIINNYQEILKCPGNSELNLKIAITLPGAFDKNVFENISKFINASKYPREMISLIEQMGLNQFRVEVIQNAFKILNSNPKFINNNSMLKTILRFFQARNYMTEDSVIQLNMFNAFCGITLMKTEVHKHEEHLMALYMNIFFQVEELWKNPNDSFVTWRNICFNIDNICQKFPGNTENIILSLMKNPSINSVLFITSAVMALLQGNENLDLQLNPEIIEFIVVVDTNLIPRYIKQHLNTIPFFKETNIHLINGVVDFVAKSETSPMDMYNNFASLTAVKNRTELYKALKSIARTTPKTRFFENICKLHALDKLRDELNRILQIPDLNPLIGAIINLLQQNMQTICNFNYNSTINADRLKQNSQNFFNCLNELNGYSIEELSRNKELRDRFLSQLKATGFFYYAKTFDKSLLTAVNKTNKKGEIELENFDQWPSIAHPPKQERQLSNSIQSTL